MENLKKKVTIKDIAREAGISPAAVSLILNNKPCRISDEKKKLVKEVARKKNYVVNQQGKRQEAFARFGIPRGGWDFSDSKHGIPGGCEGTFG